MSDQPQHGRAGSSPPRDSMGYNGTTSSGGVVRRGRKPVDRRIDTDDGEGQPRTPSRTVTMGDMQPTVPRRHVKPAAVIPPEFQNRNPTRKETVEVVRQPNVPARRARQTEIGFQPGKKKTATTTAPFNDTIPSEMPRDEILVKPKGANKLSVVREKNEDIVFEPKKTSKKSKKEGDNKKKKKKKLQRMPYTESKIDELVFQRAKPTVTKPIKTAEEIKLQPAEADIEFKPHKTEARARDDGDLEVPNKSSRPQPEKGIKSSPWEESARRSPRRRLQPDIIPQQQSASLLLQADQHASKSKPTPLSSGRRQSSAPSISNVSYSIEKETSTRNEIVEPIPQPQFYFAEPLRDERVCAARFLVASNAAEQKLYTSRRNSRKEPSEDRRRRPVPAKALSRRKSSKKEKSNRSLVALDDKPRSDDEENETKKVTASSPPISAPPDRTSTLRRHHSDISLEPYAREEVERPRQPHRKQTMKEVGGLQSFRLPSTGDSVVYTPKPRKRSDEDNGARYSKYFKMLSVGIPMRAAKNNMALDYLDPSLLDNYRYHRLKWQRSSEKSIVYNDILQTDHSTYYKMLSAGVPLVAVQQRMEWEGLDPATLDLEVYEKTKRKLRAAASDDYDEGVEDEQYAKYFNMLGRNIVMKDVKEEMAKDGLDPNILDNYQYKKVDENGRESMIETIQEDKEWEEEGAEEATAGLGKYFMMLSIGVPMQAVKQSAYQDGFDPDDLHNYQYERLDWEVTEDDVDDDDECDRIWEGDLSKYYKMLSAGVPVEGVQQRMGMEGWDPDSLDVELYHKAKKKLRSKATIEAMSSDDDVKYAKYFNMLGRGVVMADVRRAMEQDGLDPDVLDAYQYKPI